MAEQRPFGADALAALNPEPRCACVLLLDTSGSMGEPVAATGSNLVHTYQADGRYDEAPATTTIPIQRVNEAIRAFQADLSSDSLAMQRVEVSVITYGGGVRTLCPFVSASEFLPPTLAADGDTPMGAAILQAIDAVTARKSWYKQNGLHYYRPWIVCVTDGRPTDTWQLAAQRVREGEKRKEFAFFAFGVDGTDFGTLDQVAAVERKPLKLKGHDFRSLFLWLSSSLRTVSNSNPGEQVQIAVPAGWASL